MSPKNRSGFTLLELLTAITILGILAVVRHYYFVGSKTKHLTETTANYATYPDVVQKHFEALKNWGYTKHASTRLPASITDAKTDIAHLAGIRPEHLVLYVDRNGSALAAGGLIVGTQSTILTVKGILTNTGNWIENPKVEYKVSDDKPPTYFNVVTFAGVWKRGDGERAVIIRRDDTGGKFKGQVHAYTYAHHFIVEGEEWKSNLTLGKTLEGWNNLRGTVTIDTGEELPVVARVMPVALTHYGKAPPLSTIGTETMIAFSPAL